MHVRDGPQHITRRCVNCLEVHSSVKSMQDTIVPVDLPNEDSCPSQCLKKGLWSSTSSLDVSEGALHPAVATGDLGKVVELKRGYNLTDNEKYFVLRTTLSHPMGTRFLVAL